MRGRVVEVPPYTITVAVAAGTCLEVAHDKGAD